METCRKFACYVLVAMLGIFLPQSLTAQDRVSLDFRGGLSIPAGDLSTFVDASPGFTVGVDVPVHERVSIRVDGGADLYTGGEIENPVVAAGTEGADLSLVRFTGGAAVHLIRAEDSRFLVDGNVGAGVGILTSERREFSLGGGDVAIVDLSETYLTGQGGLLLGYRLSEQVSVFASGQAFLTLADEEDTFSLGLLTTDGPPENLWSFPVSVGLKFDFGQ